MTSATHATIAATTNTMSLRRATRLRCGLKPIRQYCAVLWQTMRVVRWISLALVGLMLLLAFDDSTSASPPDDTTTATLVTDTTVPAMPPSAAGPLILTPPGCVVPPPALAVFRGRVINLDDPPTTAQFRVQSMLAGSLAGYASINRVLVVYGQEASFLEIGVDYIVGVRLDLDTKRLVSKILSPAPLFGGDAVIGVEDTDLECPRIEDPVSTLLSDGTSVDSGVLTPLEDSTSELVLAVVQPLAVALAILIALVLIKDLIVSMGRSLRESTLSPRPLARVRHHGLTDQSDSADGEQRAT